MPAALLPLVVGAAFAGIAFGAAGGTELTRTTTVEVLMVLLGAAVVAGAVVWGRSGPVYGATALALFLALGVFTAVSITWAVVPELAYIEAGRTLAYFAIFAAAVAVARLAPRGAPVLVQGVAIAATAAVAYALAARVWPGSIGDTEISNRIGQPFGYWNAVGTTAALVIPALLWLGSRRGGAAAARVLAYPAMGAAVLAILLTQSRGALVAAVLVTIAWLALVPLRMRSLPVIVLPSAAAGGVGAWALSQDAFAEAALPLSVKESIAGEFGLLLGLMTVGLLVAGLAIQVAHARAAPSMRMRRRAAIAALAVALALPFVALAALAFSDRGIAGTIDDRVTELTSETETAPTAQGAGRFAAASSTRGKYWREAGRVYEERPLIGTGAGTFEVARLRHRKDPSVTKHAHGFVPQTLADLGLIGVALTSALLLAWLIAAARTTALRPRRLPFRRSRADQPPPRRDWSGDRIALVALVLIAIAFGLQSAIDWTWFVPGPAAMAIAAAGFVAGRGPSAARQGPAPGLAAHSGPSPQRLLSAAAVLLAALLTAWAIWQPEAADRATGDAIALADSGQVDAAVAKTEDASDANPLSAQPYLVRAAIETEAGRVDAARRTLEQAVLKFPGEPETWYRLAAFQQGTLDDPVAAAETVRGALYLDPLDQQSRRIFLEANARRRELEAGRTSP